ncbi:glycosyltransferase involved in cell wall biosynthesis [Christiangramia gaetbulicola]|uniref:Glycosyltransferase involved in cell wall biosynthesis n=1 Tax=Christiangramia gaetbulicola TaxID=703340 RepID=A0A2T6AKZ3_9FLAO|nr:glycosyltransferase family 4 protein [Christiangramia gaetbulicola]PTX44480.1 glycosyltransferase involved in cell wall biosynthesis [Christiangramia gaetbulicola]
MKILIVHNHYGDFAVGGEAMVFRAEVELLEKNGVKVKTYERSNSEIDDFNYYKKLKLFKNIHWSEKSKKEIGFIMDEFKPDILHVHNYKFVLTPSIFQAAKDRGIKTVLTLHNYRLMVPCGNFMDRKGRACEKCVTKSPVNVILHRCSQGSILKSSLQYRLYTKTKDELNQLIDLVDNYIVLSKFAKNKLSQTGVPINKIRVKPNFIDNSAIERYEEIKKERAVFIGRLSFEKGILQLIKMWTNIDYPLYIIGAGPLGVRAKSLASSNPNIIFMGEMDNLKVKKFLRESSFMVFPSTLYEGMPITILEAMSQGVPVLASNLGPRNELIENGVNGIIYNINNLQSFLDGAESLITDRSYRKRLGGNSLREFNKKYTEEVNFKLIEKLYSRLLDEK